MEASLWVPVSLCKAKINDIDLIIMVANTHQEIAGLHIIVNYMMRVDILNA
jgi:hypothetical protein